LSGAVFYALNPKKIVCGRTLDSLGECSPDLVAELRGPLCGREAREGKEEKEGNGEGRKKEWER